MKEISNAIREGAMAYMARQYKTIAVFAIIIFLVLLALFETPIALGFLLGAVLSGISGYIGMSISVRANSRTAETAKQGLKEALDVAFKGGSVTGMAVVGLALLAVSIFYSFYSDPSRFIRNASFQRSAAVVFFFDNGRRKRNYFKSFQGRDRQNSANAAGRE